MTTRVDVEDIETTRSEKLLATVLTAFLLIAALWVYFHVDIERSYEERDPLQLVSGADRAALDRRDAALDGLDNAKAAVEARREAMTERREAYRTALDAGRNDPGLRQRYLAAQKAYETARANARERRRAAALTRPPAARADRRVQAAADREHARVEAQERHDGRVSFARRLALVLVALAGALALLGQLRKRRSRWLTASMAAVSAAALTAVVMAVDYLTDYVEVTDLGVLVLSGAGALMTIAAFAVLQRYLARRLPRRRVRRRECPFCGFPTGDGPHCAGCGREVVAECATCHSERRVGTQHCATCGAI